MPDVLLFDLGGVLVDNTAFAALARMMRDPLPETELKARWLHSAAVRRFETGGMDDESFAAAIVAEFGLPLRPSALLEVFPGWVKGFYPGATALLATLRRRHRIGCLSNSNALHWRAAYERAFDFAHVSHLTGFIKPDRAAFAHVTDAEGVAPAQVIFFDDSPANVAAATQHGFRAYHTAGLAELRATLLALGILRPRR